MAELLLELFCEEIPARMQAKAEGDLRDALTKGLAEAGVEDRGDACVGALARNSVSELAGDRERQELGAMSASLSADGMYGKTNME